MELVGDAAGDLGSVICCFGCPATLTRSLGGSLSLVGVLICGRRGSRAAAGVALSDDGSNDSGVRSGAGGACRLSVLVLSFKTSGEQPAGAPVLMF